VKNPFPQKQERFFFGEIMMSKLTNKRRSVARFAKDDVKALLFDVFGTVVDWRTSITRQAETFGRRHGVSGDWSAFADRWREGYISGMVKVNGGADEWKNVDQIHRDRLDILLAEYGFPFVEMDEVAEFNRAWHRLDPWPDSVAGLSRLKKRFIISSLSNGNVALLVNMARFAALPWDCVLSSELAGRYKPDHGVYQYAASILDLRNDQVMMVAAHDFDVRAAAEAGLRTAYVSRPAEYGGNGPVEEVVKEHFDIYAIDFHDLASQLECS
jgi:2-haloacid dehalogenase